MDLLLRSLTLLYAALASFFSGEPQRTTRYYDFLIKEINVTRLCKAKTILAVNGEFPGPTIYAEKGDRVVVRVRNEGHKNITIHWHGVLNRRNPWVDGPEYVTQCPIAHGRSFTYDFQLAEEEGTLWWHAHNKYDRVTVHGAIVILPRRHRRRRLGKMHVELPERAKQSPIIIGEWFSGALVLPDHSRPPPEPSAFTINGQPGDLTPCSKSETFKLRVEHGNTYLLRLVNAALGSAVFFAVARHELTVIATDASYVNPLTTDYVVIYPGQTMDVLLTANKPVGLYYMAAKVFEESIFVGIDRTTATAIVEYARPHRAKLMAMPANPVLPELPEITDSEAGFSMMKLRSLVDSDKPIDVPQNIDRHIFMTASMALAPCPPKVQCADSSPYSLIMAALNNVTFALPKFSILEAYYANISGVYTPDFPDKPPLEFNYIALDPPALPDKMAFANVGPKVVVLDYNTTVEIVLQGTGLLNVKATHPVHLHGYSFYVVGSGTTGIFDKTKDPLRYNLVDPLYVNTVAVPGVGWVAIRFRATNPGVWFFHCHREDHVVWGMATVFIVKNGEGPEASMLPPPSSIQMPSC